MNRPTFRPGLEALEERALASANPVLTRPAAATHVQARCVGLYLTDSPAAVTVRNTSRYNILFKIHWGDEDGQTYESFKVLSGQSVTARHDYGCPGEGAVIRFDKAVKAGYQAKEYTLSLGSNRSPSNYQFINVTWSLSGKGVDLRHIV
jgi:hypothetical protein